MRAVTACTTAFLIGFVWAMTPTLSLADRNETLASEARAAFERGIDNKHKLLQARKDFSSATDAYFELHRCGVRNPALYRNLGNAAFLADRWPEAIWAYHVGLRFDPNDHATR